MFVRHLSITDFRSYAQADFGLEPGVTAFVGPNGQGKTNLVEAVGYLASLDSHRVATDAPLVRAGADRAVVRGSVVRDGRETRIEVEPFAPVSRSFSVRLLASALTPRRRPSSVAPRTS